MSDEKNAAEPTVASGGSLANYSVIPNSCLRGSTVEQRFCEPTVAGSTPAAGLYVQWIPVSERLPDRNIYVIARCRGGQAMEYLYADGLFFRNGEERRVTHWQHFPEPPQDGE